MNKRALSGLLVSAWSLSGLEAVHTSASRDLSAVLENEPIPVDYCNACPMTAVTVCGEDGNTYQNECLAICQGVSIVAQGSCSQDTSVEELSSFVEDGVVDLTTMNRFRDENFKLVGKRTVLPPTEELEEVIVEEPKEEDTKNGSEQPKEKSYLIHVSRITNDLFEYRAVIDASQLPQILDSPPAMGTTSQAPPAQEAGGDDAAGNEAGAGDGDRRRKLWVFGSDDRYEYTTTPPWPEALNGRTSLGCSGTVIGPNAVLTAGHCVYSGGDWREADFTPSLHTTWYGETVAPYGTFTWNYMTTFTQWAVSGDQRYNLAVVRYHPDSFGYKLGDYLGYAGLRQTDSSSWYLSQSYLAGYPADKAVPNYELWESYCGDVFDQNTGPYLVDHFCDTDPYGGNSGSSFMDAAGYVHGIHSARYSDGSANAGVLLEGNHYFSVFNWAGL